MNARNQALLNLGHFADEHGDWISIAMEALARQGDDRADDLERQLLICSEHDPKWKVIEAQLKLTELEAATWRKRAEWFDKLYNRVPQEDE